MNFLDDFDATAVELVTEFGTDASYVRATAGTYNPATGTAALTTQALATKAVLVDLALMANGFKPKDGTEIQAGDKMIYALPPSKFGGPSFAPDPVNDTIVVAGVTYQITVVKEINPTGANPLVYLFYVRR